MPEWDLDLKSSKARVFLCDSRNCCVEHGEEGVWVPSLPRSLRKQEAGRINKGAKEKEQQTRVGHTKVF